MSLLLNFRNVPYGLVVQVVRFLDAVISFLQCSIRMNTDGIHFVMIEYTVSQI